MRAIILAAGEGTRLMPHTLDRPKCLVPLAGRPLLDWQIAALHRAGIQDVTVVTGYRAEAIEALGVPTIHNTRYRETNMVSSLLCARALLDGSDDVIVCYGDVVCEPRVIEALAGSPAPLAITIDRAWRRLWDARMADPLADAETLRLADGHVVELGRRPSGFHEIEGQYMGLVGIKRAAAMRVVEAYDALDPDGSYDGRDRNRMFMTSFLQHLIDRVMPVAAVVCVGGWLEVDTAEDLRLFESLHAAGTLNEYCRLAAPCETPIRADRRRLIANLSSGRVADAGTAAGPISLAALVKDWLQMTPAPLNAATQQTLDLVCRQIDVHKRIAECYSEEWTPVSGSEAAAPIAVSGLVATLLAHAEAPGAQSLKYANSALKALDLYTGVPAEPALRAWAWEVLDRAMIDRGAR